MGFHLHIKIKNGHCPPYNIPHVSRSSSTPASSLDYNASMTAHKRTIIFGILGILGIGILALGMLTGSVALAERLHSSIVKGAAKIDPDTPNLTALNIRLSNQPVQAQKDLVKHSVDLPQVRAARSMIAPSPKAAILEDDNHNRVVILSASEGGQVHAQVLEDLDFSAKIPFITTCADHRGCAFNRQPVTGGLACVAICVQQALDPSHELTP